MITDVDEESVLCISAIRGVKVSHSGVGNPPCIPVYFTFIWVEKHLHIYIFCLQHLILYLKPISIICFFYPVPFSLKNLVYLNYNYLFQKGGFAISYHKAIWLMVKTLSSCSGTLSGHKCCFFSLFSYTQSMDLNYDYAKDVPVGSRNGIPSFAL